jgi:predicted HTH domain antitoxin
MTTTTESETVHTILSLARQLSTARRQWVAELLSRESDTPLPEHATLDEAIALYLLDACSLGRAAELAGVTRWDLQDRLQELRIPLSIAGEQSAHELDDLAEQLEREGVL